MITVAYDPQIFLMQKRGGISRYFVELIKSFQENPQLGIKPVLVNNRVINEYAIRDLQEIGVTDCSGILQPWRELLLSLSRSSSDQDWDLIHHTFYLAPFLSKYGNLKRISTLHDMIPEIYENRSFFPNEHFQKKKYLEQSTAVISVSNSTLNLAKDHYSFEIEAKSVVVHHGINKEIGNASQIWHAKRDPYILYVGNRSGYKQGMLLIGAFSRLLDIDSLNLIFVGGGKFLKSERDLISALNLESRISHVEANDLQLSELYRSAQVFVLPSLCEGFGLPALEAMASGCPVILSDTSALSEVAGGAAKFFTAGDENSLAGVIREVVTNSLLRNAMTDAGVVQITNFSWQKCAQETAAVYRGALEGKYEKSDSAPQLKHQSEMKHIRNRKSL